MKLRTGEPWMPADEYGRSLQALSLNLIVSDIQKALHFQIEVLGAKVTYSDPDFAVLQAFGAEWMMHADHTYENHALINSLQDVDKRGAGVEIRLHGCDPDKAEAAAQRNGYQVLVPATTKAHGLREAYLLDSDGYLWVPDVHAG